VAAKTWMAANTERPPSSFEARPSGRAPQNEGFETKTWMAGTSPAMTNTRITPPCQAAWRGAAKGGVPSLIMPLIWSRSSGVS
jgi:hypothetical protein